MIFKDILMITMQKENKKVVMVIMVMMMSLKKNKILKENLSNI